jgi:NADH:ubiquinone oxidoreductase subunit C
MADEVREPDHEGEPEAPVPPRAVDDRPPDEVAAALCDRFADSIFFESHGQSVVYVERSQLAAAAAYLRDEEQFTMCVDVTAVDHLVDGVRHAPVGVLPERFEVVANFLSHARNRRIRLVCEVPDSDPTVPSLTAVYPGTNFPEREVFDLMGIRFDGHPDLTRILMPDDWIGHPLRKDDPSARVPVTFKGDPRPR